MKRLPSIITISLAFAFIACQKDNPKELEAILEHQLLQEEVHQLASKESAEAINVFADKRLATCIGISFADALKSFVETNQEKANSTCQVVKGPITGCHEGYTTYATALVFPDPNLCSYFDRNSDDIHH